MKAIKFVATTIVLGYRRFRIHRGGKSAELMNFATVMKNTIRPITIATTTGMLVLVVASSVGAQTQNNEANVLRPAWEALSERERENIQRNYIVIVSEPSDFGLVMDTQGVDQSTPGSNMGSEIGATVASAAYLENAIKNGNRYSPLKDIAFSVLGAIIGSAANKPAISQYQFRYALRLSDGEIVTRDIVQSNPFRYSTGMCLSLSSLVQAPQSLCGQTADDIRKKYLGSTAVERHQVTRQDTSSIETESTTHQPVDPSAADGVQQSTQPSAKENVTCKLKNQYPVSISREKCQMLEGVEQ